MMGEKEVFGVRLREVVAGMLECNHGGGKKKKKGKSSECDLGKSRECLNATMAVGRRRRKGSLRNAT
jgi:hypothetical protein